MCQYWHQHVERKKWHLKAEKNLIRKAAEEDYAFLREMLYE